MNDDDISASETDGRRRRATASRQLVLDSAQYLFSMRGYRATSVRGIARHLGMTHAGVLKHFSRKDDILFALLDRVDDGFRRVTPGPVGDPTGCASELLAIAAHQASSPQLAPLLITLLGEATSANHPARSYVSRRISTLGQLASRSFDDEGADLVAGWDGLQLLALYLPLGETIVSDLAARMNRIAIVSGLVAAPRPGETSLTSVDLSIPAPALTDPESSIISAAGESFIHNGFRGTTIRGVADRVGISHASVLYRFPTKEALLEAVLDSRDARADIVWVQEPRTPLDRIYNLYRRAAYNEQSVELVELYAVLVCEATDATHPAHDYFRRRFEWLLASLTADIESLVRAGGSRGDVDPAQEARWLIGLAHGLQLHSFYRTSVSVSERILAELRNLAGPAAGALVAEDLVSSPGHGRG